MILNSVYEGVGTVQVVEVSVHQGPVGVTSGVLITEQVPTMDIKFPPPPLSPTISEPLLVQGTSVAAPLLVSGLVLPPGTQAPITMQGPAFLSIPSAPIMFPGAQGAPAPMQTAGAPLQSAAMPPMAGELWPSQATPYPSAFMAPPAWLIYA